MSSDQIDSPARPDQLPADAKPFSLSAAGKLAGSAAGLAGVDAKALGLAGTALDAAATLQAGSGAAALATGLRGLAGQANPQLGQALQVASQLQSLAQQGGNVAGQAGQAAALIKETPTASAVAEAAAPALEKLVIAEHPLAGQAVSDFAAADPQYVPAAIDPSVQGDEEAAVAGALARFNDGTRLLRFFSPLTGEKALLIESLNGTSGLSEQFVFNLSLISENAAIDLKDLMGKNVSVAVQLADGGDHFINGYVHSFGFSHADGGFAFYHAQIVPWFSYLKQRVNSRIFQDQSVLEVIDTLFKGDYNGLANYEFRTGQTYRPETYIVQYDETDEHFVSRLMEKYGLFYYFEHKPNGHVMVISDDSRSSVFCPPQQHHAEVEFNGGNRWHDRDSVTALAAERNLQPTKVALNTFDFKSPNTLQYVELPTVTQQGDMPTMEVYDGNPAFSYKDKDDGTREARQRLEVLEWQAKVFTGASDCRGLIAGHTFKLLDHHWFDPAGDGDNDFIVLSVQYSARNNYFARGQADVYRNTFTAIRRKIPYRPRRVHQMPRMPGPQTATVVGPKGTEIHTDKFGRIKVQFHWDRYGRRDERSSCWIRVSQPWAGQGWGTISIPRIGQEVIIDYLEGDPDRPVCTGRLFNADQPAPYGLPDGAHMMGFKSRSTPGGGGFCEMVIHDQKGKELINIHSQKDMVTTVQNTQATVVNGPHQTNTVSSGYQTNTVKQYIVTTAQTGHIHETAKTNIELTAEDAHIHQTAKTHIELTAQDDYIHQTAKTNIELVAQNAHLHQTAKQNIELTSQTEHIHLKANTDITLEVGSSKIVLQADGTILIQGVNVTVLGSRIDLNK
ncbi:type VI secretion system tip protein TssI/VgrG [Pseudoduganella plicata]|uniref:Type IV secretion protein Rhs n=1 Tax=Pseudoduganella plicata TaxID=321984 RepID=A0A4P7BBH3_9BURK|nr:type VI secretion system tip protein TssI/VgrG [Pseudoduganella plicata]QBQ35490.1 type VI secretion system tip protein VgrG [Pseudoduganella plicata]GGZ02172.1 type IV secretion protein Rhs [Pseudoduganella plicata]